MDILKNKVINFNKLIEFGFVERNGNYSYSTYILNKQFKLHIEISEDSKISTKLIELDTDEEYILHKTDYTGEFVGCVRDEYESIMTSIMNNCFERDVFKEAQTREIIKYINDKYGDELEFLWKKFDNNAIIRRKDNKKWYILFISLPKKKLALKGENIVEIIDIRVEYSRLIKLLDKKHYFPAYHMNKKSWMTILLDGTLDDKDLFQLIDESYLLAKR